MTTLKKIYLFSLVNSQYGVLSNFTEQLSAALERQGIKTKIIKAERNDPKAFLEAILKDPPDCTLSFNGLLPDESDRFLCDLIQIPHVAYLVDSPIYFAPIIKSKLNIVASVDADFCQAFKNSNFDQVIFLPHATSRDLHADKAQKREYDVLMLNSMIDPEETKLEWHGKYSKELIAVLEEATELTLNDNEIPYTHAFLKVYSEHQKAGKKLNPKEFFYAELFNDLEFYLEGKALTEMIRSIEADLHIFGSDSQKWKKYLKKGQSNVKLHEEVRFEEALDLMKKAKILLNCAPKMKRAGHERIFSGLACESAVVALDNPFLRGNFKDKEDILLFQYGKWDDLNKTIGEYLQDESKRSTLAKKGRDKVIQEHTWDQRAQRLLQELPQYLEGIKTTSEKKH